MSIIVADTFKARVVGAAITTEYGLNVGGATTVAGAITADGTVTASSFSGDGAGLTGVASTDNIITGTAVTITNTTNSTSTTTGALQVSGGVGVALSMTVGGSLSVGGTITYEDVTNVDSVGLITARSGIQFGVAGVGGTIRANGDTTLVGVVTASSFKATSSPTITIRDGATEKGYIGFNGNDPFIGRKDGVGLSFQNNKVRPVDGDDGSPSNNTVDIGEPTYKFKDLYLAGNANIAGAASTFSGNLNVGSAVTVYGSSGIVSATSFSGDGSNLSGIAGGLQEIDLWTITADSSNTNWDDGDNDVLGGGSFGVNIARCTTTQNAMFAKQGTGMSYSSGVFTFPSTGTYEVLANLFYRPSETGNKFMHLFMQLTVNNSSYAKIYKAMQMSNWNDPHQIILGPVQLTITDTTNQKIRFTAKNDSNQMYFNGATDMVESSFSFKKLA